MVQLCFGKWSNLNTSFHRCAPSVSRREKPRFLVDKPQLSDEQFVVLPMSIEVTNSWETHTCIYPFLLVIALMNVSSEFLVLLFASDCDHFKNTCLGSHGMPERFPSMNFHVLKKKLI